VWRLLDSQWARFAAAFVLPALQVTQIFLLKIFSTFLMFSVSLQNLFSDSPVSVIRVGA
jgi:hypothetical protein